MTHNLTSDLTTHLIQFPTPGCVHVQVCAMVHVHVHGIFVLITPSCHSAFLKWAADDRVYCNKAGGMRLEKGLMNDKYLALIVLTHTSHTDRHTQYGDYNALLNLQLETIFLILRILQYFYMYHVFLLWASQR